MTRSHCLGALKFGARRGKLARNDGHAALRTKGTPWIGRIVCRHAGLGGESCGGGTTGLVCATAAKRLFVWVKQIEVVTGTVCDGPGDGQRKIE
jgi:hypothetical protein